jgi:hypothetical protein
MMLLAVPLGLAVVAGAVLLAVVVVVAVVVLPLVLAVAGHHHLAVLAVHLALQAGPEGGGLVRSLPPTNRWVVMHVPEVGGGNCNHVPVKKGRWQF